MIDSIGNIYIFSRNVSSKSTVNNAITLPCQVYNTTLMEQEDRTDRKDRKTKGQ